MKTDELTASPDGTPVARGRRHRAAALRPAAFVLLDGLRRAAPRELQDQLTS